MFGIFRHAEEGRRIFYICRYLVGSFSMRVRSLSKRNIDFDPSELQAFEQLKLVQCQHALAVETGKVPKYGGDRYASNYEQVPEIETEITPKKVEVVSKPRILINAESEVSSQ